MNYEVLYNNYTVAVIESVFKGMNGAEYEDVFDASVYLFNFVSNEKIYPPSVVQGFYSAMAIIAWLTPVQFMRIREIYR